MPTYAPTLPARGVSGQNQSMTTKTPAPAPLPDLFREVAPNVTIPDPFDAPPLRWGILGAGGIARLFARDVPRLSKQQVVAVGSRDLQRAQAFAAEMNIPTENAFGSYEELVACPDVDVIYVATPHMRHRNDAILALNAGKPVLVEKPFAMSAAQAEEVFELAREKNLFAMEGMWARHLPHYHFIRDAVATGRLGSLVQVSADHGQRLTHVPRLIEPELAGGAMLDLGVYPLSLIQMTLGSPKRQRALARISERGVDLGDVVIGEHETGLSQATCQMDGATVMPALLVFEGGVISMPKNFYRPTKVKLTIHDLDPVSGAATSSMKAKWDARVPGGFQYQAADAARRITAGELESPAVPWSATLEVQAMMDAALDEVGVTYPAF